MKKESIIRTLDRLKKNPGEGLVSKFSWEDKTEEGEGWIRIRTFEGNTLTIWVQDGKGLTIADPGGSELKWSCTKKNIEYAIEICGGLWGV